MWLHFSADAPGIWSANISADRVIHKTKFVALGTEDAAVVFESYYFCRIGDYVCCERSVFVQTASDRSDRLDLLLHVFMP